MSQFPFYSGGFAIPSMNTVLEGVENHPWFGRWENQVWLPASISGASRDAGNTVPTLLRTGLLLGRITSSGLLKEWNPTGTDGSEVIYGVLGAMVNAQMNAADQDRYVGFIQIAGCLYSDRIVVPDTAAEGIVGHAREYQIYNQLAPRFLLDRHFHMGQGGMEASRYRYLTAAEITADAVTVLESEHRRTFVMTGADANTTFTVPAAEVGLTFSFFNNVATHTMNVTVASGSIKLPDIDGTAATFALQFGESATIIGVTAGEYQMIAQTELTTD